MPNPNHEGCVEPGWSFYYYRHPVIFQEMSHTGQLRFVGFAYMDACKQSGRGERGGTSSTLMELDLVWAPDVLQRWAQLDARPIDEALPHIAHPGDNAFRYDLPAFPAHGLPYADYYNENAHLCQYRPEDVDLVCPGIPPEFGNTILADAGYTRWRDRFGNYRWSPAPESPIMSAWFLSRLSTQPPNPEENFYARHWADDMRYASRGDGGLIRVILHPVDLTVHSIPETTPVTADGEAIIPLAIGNPSNRNSLRTSVGWRQAGNNDWQPIEAWRYQGETEWRPYSQKVQLLAWASQYIEVRLSNVADGQTIQLMANERKEIPEAAVNVASNYDAYLNNIGRTRLEGGELDLEIVAIEAPASVGCQLPGSYQARWTIRNHSNRTVTVKRQASVTSALYGSWSLGTKTLTLPPGDTTEAANVSIVRCDDTSTVRVEINPDRSPAESTYENNTRTRRTAIGAAPQVGPQPGQSGSGRTIIVPGDCQVNPDPTSEYPCLNYPNLRISP